MLKRFHHRRFQAGKKVGAPHTINTVIINRKTNIQLQKYRQTVFRHEIHAFNLITHQCIILSRDSAQTQKSQRVLGLTKQISFLWKRRKHEMSKEIEEQWLRHAREGIKLNADGKHKEAIEALNKSIALNKNITYKALGVALFRIEKYYAAIEVSTSQSRK